MAQLSWTEELSTGIAEQDEQHKTLISLVNRLSDAMREGKDAALLDAILEELADYTVYHFGYEEELMDRHNFADFDAHKQEHQTFVDWVNDVKRKCRAGETVVSAQIINFLRLWVTGHIMKTDKKMGLVLSSVGVI